MPASTIALAKLAKCAQKMQWRQALLRLPLERERKPKTPRPQAARHPSFSSSYDPPTTSSSSHRQVIHFFLVDSPFRFESLRVAGVLDFGTWGSAASALALRISSGTSEIFVQPNAHALVLKSGRSPDVTAQPYPSTCTVAQTWR